MEGTGAAAGAAPGAAQVAALRARAVRMAADAAGQLREVHALEAAIRADLAADPPHPVGDVLFRR